MLKKQINKLSARAILDPASINAEKRTIDVIFATETPVLRFGWEENYNEVLSMQPDKVRLQRLNNGAPVLNSHSSYDLGGVIGVVESASVDGTQGKATLRFSNNAEVDPIWNNIKDGIVRNVSVGYRVYQYERTPGADPKKDTPTYRAQDWEPMEISMVPIPADANASVRGEGKEANEVEILNLNNSNTSKNVTMTEEEKRAAEAEQQRKADEAAKAKAADDAKADETRKAATEAERIRSTSIVEACRNAALTHNFAETLIKEGKTIDQARTAIIDEWAKNDPIKYVRGGNVEVTQDATDKKRAAFEEAILFRTDKKTKLVAGGDSFRGYHLMDMARECVEDAGMSTKGMSRREIAEASLNCYRGMSTRAGLMSTSDFPNILGNTINRVLRREYDVQPRTFTPWTREVDAKDFRPMTVAQIGDLDPFNLIPEGGEYPFAKLGDASEAYSVRKYGEIIPLTWEAIINDDLGAFGRIPQKIAMQAAQKQSDIIYAVLVTNALMGDGNALFSSAHGNLVGSGTAISTTSLDLARQALRTQKGLGAKNYLNIVPKYLVVAPQNETLANQMMSANYLAVTSGTINVFAGLLQIIVEPRITDKSWYVIGDPANVDTIQYSFLEGEGEVFTEQRTGFEVDGLQIKARMVFGAKAIDWRAIYKNPGA